MRAYTSLVGHLLGSHPEIDGYYEMHQSYASAEDLARQAQRYAEQHSLKPGSRYLFDKLLHNDYTLALEQLDPDRTIVLMALRPPEPTLKSIVSLFARKPGDDPVCRPGRRRDLLHRAPARARRVRPAVSPAVLLFRRGR